MVLRNSGRVGSRRFFDRIDRKAEGSGSNKRTGPFVILGMLTLYLVIIWRVSSCFVSLSSIL